MRTILLLIFTSFQLILTAQTAPDFTVTDIHGQVHHLYADYLNQGKTVVIKIFFTTCPPCNSIAPLMEPFIRNGEAVRMMWNSLNCQTRILIPIPWYLPMHRIIMKPSLQQVLREGA
ncbi:MAG: redoxin domain-containing protein [Saprospiraceae bacterium]|nr:redoxin domain-containing protein [Candidatus Opimibacter iunctus]